MEIFIKDNGALDKAELEERVNGRAYQVIIKYKNDTFFAEETDWFRALQNLRRQFEKRKIELLCNGSRKEIWPSGMSRDMGGGKMAYICEPGKPGIGSVDIFETSPDIKYSTVDEQEKYIKNWFDSLGKKSFWAKLLKR